MTPALSQRSQMSPEQEQHPLWRKWWGNSSLHTSGDLQLTKQTISPTVWWTLTWMLSLGSVSVTKDGYGTQNPSLILTVTLALALESHRLRFESPPPRHSLALWPWATLFTFLYLCPRLKNVYDSIISLAHRLLWSWNSMMQIKHLASA